MSGVILDTIGRTVFRLGYEISPIILTNGVAANLPGGLLPIVAITEAANLVVSLLSGSFPTSLDAFFAHYRPLPGTSLVENEFGQYPFANQSVAANAIVTRPLRVSLEMICPVRGPGGYTAKLTTFSALKATLDLHHASGGTYTVATPAYIYQNLLLTSLRHVGDEGGKQAQVTWQWDFEQPLLTLADAAAAQNAQMAALTNGTQGAGSTSGLASTVGSTGTGAAASLGGAGSGSAGAAVGSFSYVSPTVVPVTASPLPPP